MRLRMHVLTSARSAWDTDGTLRDAELTGTVHREVLLVSSGHFARITLQTLLYVLAFTNLKLPICLLGSGIIISLSIGQYQCILEAKK